MDRAVIALAWYSENEYSRFLDLSADPDTWDRDYKSWKLKAEDLIRRLTAEGIDVVKVPLTFAEVEKWCAREGKRNVAASRSRIAAEKLQSGTKSGTQSDSRD